MTEIIKYEETYLITYKNGDTEEVSKIGGESLIKQLVDKQWVIINGNGYNRFEILNCKKITRDGEAIGLLKKELDIVQVEVKKYMKLDKKQMTPGRMIEMIRVAKERLHIN